VCEQNLGIQAGGVAHPREKVPNFYE